MNSYSPRSVADCCRAAWLCWKICRSSFPNGRRLLMSSDWNISGMKGKSAPKSCICQRPYSQHSIRSSGYTLCPCLQAQQPIVNIFISGRKASIRIRYQITCRYIAHFDLRNRQLHINSITIFWFYLTSYENRFLAGGRVEGNSEGLSRGIAQDLDKGIAEVKDEAAARRAETPRKFAQRLLKHYVTPAQVALVTGIPIEEIGELRLE